MPCITIHDKDLSGLVLWSCINLGISWAPLNYVDSFLRHVGLGI